MSQLVANGDILISEVVVYRPSNSQIAVLRRHHVVQSVIGASINFGNVAAALSAAWAPSYKDLIYNGADFRGVRVRRAWPSNTDAWAQFTADAGPGISGPNALPSQTCGLVTFGGPTLGASGEGRQYLPFPATLDNDSGGLPTTGYKNRLTVLGVLIAADQIITNGADTCDLYHVGWKGPGGSFRFLDTVLRVGNWATQKSRGSYGRVNALPF